MKLVETIRRQPQPFRALWMVTLASFIPWGIGVANQPESKEGLMQLLLVPTPVLFSAMGLVMALNVNDNASILAEESRRSQKPQGKGYIQFFGAFMAAGGVWMTVMVLTGKG